MKGGGTVELWRVLLTVTVDVRLQVEAEIARRVALRGRPIQPNAATLLEEAVDLPSAHSAPAARNMVELFAPLRGHADNSIPRPASLSRSRFRLRPIIAPVQARKFLAQVLNHVFGNVVGALGRLSAGEDAEFFLSFSLFAGVSRSG